MKIKRKKLNQIITEEVEYFIHNHLNEIISTSSELFQKLKSEMGPEKLLDEIVAALAESTVMEALRYIAEKQKTVSSSLGEE